MSKLNEFNTDADNGSSGMIWHANLRTRRFQAGNWLVDPESNRLALLHSETSAIRPLEPRIMLLLCVLAANAGRVLRRDDLMNCLWPRVIVNENSLTRAVSELRKALEPDPGASLHCENDLLIETVPKTGYRLTGKVSYITCATSQQESTTTIMEVNQPATAIGPGAGYTKTVRALMATAACLAVTSSVLLWQLLTAANSPAGQLLLSDVTQSTGEELQFLDLVRNNPNSFTIADLYDATVNESLVSGPIEALPTSNQNLAGSHAELLNSANDNSVLSRDGELYAYVSYTDSGSSLVLGSVNSFSSPVNVYETEEFIYNLQWSPVENVLLFAQKARLSPASLLLGEVGVSLVMFDLATMTATVLQRGDKELEQSGAGPNRFSLT